MDQQVYIALWQAMRDLIPLRALLQDFISTINIKLGTSTTYSTVFEDNTSCFELIKASHPPYCTQISSFS
jgi:hypothetical protein